MAERGVPTRRVRTPAVKMTEVRREVQRLADRPVAWATWHCSRMEGDPEYRSAVQHLTGMLASHPGQVGGIARRVLASHHNLTRLL